MSNDFQLSLFHAFLLQNINPQMTRSSFFTFGCLLIKKTSKSSSINSWPALLKFKTRITNLHTDLLFLCQPDVSSKNLNTKINLDVSSDTKMFHNSFWSMKQKLDNKVQHFEIPLAEVLTQNQNYLHESSSVKAKIISTPSQFSLKCSILNTNLIKSSIWLIKNEFEWDWDLFYGKSIKAETFSVTFQRNIRHS